MTSAETAVGLGTLLLLLGGFVAAAVWDLKAREIDDHLWEGMGLIGVAAGAAVEFGHGSLPFLLWLIVGLFALEHLVPWDEAFTGDSERWVLPVEAAIYLGVLITVGSAAVKYGVGASSTPVVVLALLASVLVARGLFELGVLYGGADAKAVIVAGVLVPILPVPWLYAPALFSPVLGFVPFTITLLTNSAVLSLAVPLALAVRNVSRGEFDGTRGFTGYSLPVSELPHRYVWVRDPRVERDTYAEDVDTSEEDVQRRTELAAALTEEGIDRVWVSPQIPFIVVMAFGAVAAVLAGNLLLDLFAVLG